MNLDEMVRTNRHWSDMESLVDKKDISESHFRGMRFDLRQCAAEGARAGYKQALRDILLDFKAGGEAHDICNHSGGARLGITRLAARKGISLDDES